MPSFVITRRPAIIITQECGETNAKEKEGSEVENDVQKGRPNTHLNEMWKANAEMRDAYQNPSPSWCSFLGIIVFTVHNKPIPFHSVIGEGRPNWASMGLTLPFFSLQKSDFGLLVRWWAVAIFVYNVMICGYIILSIITKYIACYLLQSYLHMFQ